MAQAAATTDQWETSIADVLNEDINIRGTWLTHLIRESTFTELAYLILTGRHATAAQARVLDAIFVSIAEHGISPSSTVTRALASYGVPIQVGIAAGQLTVGDHHGGAGELFALQLRELVAGIPTGDAQPPSHEQILAAAESMVRRARASRTPIHGFGHPQHDADPRVAALRSVADEQGVSGVYCALLDAIQAALSESVGRHLPMNIDGISAALLLDLGLDPRTARPILMAPRVLGLAAHFIEEVDQQNVWRHVPLTQVTYTGAAAPEK